MKPSELNDAYGLVGAVYFDEGPGGLPRMRLRAKGGEAHLLLHGAHLIHWRPAGGEPVLFLSDRSAFEAGQPVRGGVPICWPWFGHAGPAPDSPHHGFARLRQWRVEAVSTDSQGAVSASLSLAPDAETRALWPHAFVLRFSVSLAGGLTMALETRNTGEAPFTITEALHTYLRVGDIRRVSVTGLEGAEYLDETESFARKRQDEAPLTFAGETDRCYVGSRAVCVLHDPVLRRRIRIQKEGSNSTVVWNPWAERAAALPDLDDDEWPRMLCIETANACEDALTLGPGQAHTVRAILSVTAA